MTRVWVVVIAGALIGLLAACSTGGGSGSRTGGSSGDRTGGVPAPQAPPDSQVSTASAATKCSALIGDPDWAKKLARDGVCVKANGDFVVASSFDCKDGSQLYQFDDRPFQYWGNSTGQLRRTTKVVAVLPAYEAAFVKCGKG